MEAAALKVESLACIDSTTLSHSELLALSLSSLCAFDLRATNDLVTPKIDPALFNESAGSRRQTYSRPQSSPTGRRRRLAGLLPAPKPPPLPAHDPENAENRLIIDYLKQLIREDPKFDQVHLASPSLPPPNVKRKRGRKPKLKLHLEHCYRGIDILNRNGVAVDLSQLATSQDPFADELKRRTEGLSSEEELLGFLRDLPGQWGSRRKKRRIVDASDFGDVLPLSWKILLGLKRKDGRAWIYCRRYIRAYPIFDIPPCSPSGQQFVSCKEVSSYLQSLLGNGDGQSQSSRRSENVVQEQIVPAENSAGVTPERQDQRQIVAVNAEVPGLFAGARERVKEVALLGIENLADVQIQDLFECRKCNMSFDEKDSYLQHLLSVHQRTTRRYRLGSSVGDGVIIKDGKFECQFCHKVFLERRRYNGHVGIHVRNYVRRVEDSPGQINVQRTDDKSPVREDVPLRISKMDALIEIAQNSIMEGCVTEPHHLAKLNGIPASDVAVGYLDQDGNSEAPISEKQMEDSLTKKNVDHHGMDGKVEEVDNDNRVIDVKMVTFLDNMGLLSVNKQDVKASETSEVKDDVELTIEELDQSGIDLDGVSEVHLSELNMIPESEKGENSESSNAKVQFKPDEGISNKSDLEFGLNCLKDVPVTVSTDVQEMVMAGSEENVVHSRAFNSSISTEQPMDCLPAFSSDKGGKQFCRLENEHDNVKGLEELRFDEIDSVDYDFARIQDSPSPPAVSAELANDAVMGETFLSSVQFESQLTTVCVWCGIEFNHDAVNSEIQPDSVGFMCPACKAKISGQINVLDCESPNAGCL
ncbi:Methyl-CpG-binding domain-containing protein [Vigna angularis]|uniref:Methyl-CpG-binding domain-containing protein n=2 Tax=Phaseolus angularis TaxID=3914 RepID=A0A8T0K9G4_PHAAN|nr:Methyl-CpG-binding domain-containing protein [Vigna angularis]